MRTPKRLLGALLTLSGAGCGSGGPSDASTSDPPVTITRETICRDVLETRALAWSERSPLGFSADELLGGLGTQYRGRLTYDDGTTSPLTLGLDRASGSVEYQRYSLGGTGVEPSPRDSSADGLAIEGCPDVLSIPATLSLQTGDGHFSEAMPLSLYAGTATSATGGVPPIDLRLLMGSYSLTEAEASQYDELKLQVNITFAAELWSGSLAVAAMTIVSTGPDGIVMVELLDVGTF
jgi:hypothetical protein